MVELLDLGPFWFAQPVQNGAGVRDCASNDVAYTLMRFVGRQRSTAIGDKLIKVEHTQVPRAQAAVAGGIESVYRFPATEMLNRSAALFNQLRACLSPIFLTSVLCSLTICGNPILCGARRRVRFGSEGDIGQRPD